MIALLLWTASAAAWQLNLAWDPSPDASVVGYRLYYGHASRAYGSMIDVGNQLARSVPDLDDTQNYFFAVTAYVATGVESAFSNEVFAAAQNPQPAVVVEYRNANLDHYFITISADEIGKLDAGLFAGWTRTGLSFKAFDAPVAGAQPVCRYYIPPVHGDSHFLSASADECAIVAQRTQSDPNYSGYVLESASAFYIRLPDVNTGLCDGNTINVYRLWNQRADSNHRYTSDPAVKARMIALGYFAEGYGADAVAMCAPP